MADPGPWARTAPAADPAPTLLVLCGEEDALVPARYADDFAAEIANTTKLIVPGAGHLVTVEAAEQVIAPIGVFVDRAEAVVA